MATRRIPDQQLYYAARNGDIEGMKTALFNGADINWKNPIEAKWTPLHIAAFSNRSESVQWLLFNGAAVDSRDVVSCILNDTHIITT
ncbi:PREDICTED: 26S proteasome non-ATPase regulatory subunit 10-like [Amphimedon queenslandica]|uniref:Uncharacterized protein n=1 Tax=Amphimedon queenslandica TaxID=400682 RepID=A0AAN0JSE7_AMPQE|nr:PREDICTED: 26S proteasome non-ATPase regulatory subunit 10-like [Amphimedon queenslandica]|eukprot:XP_019859806.1 PREDICTED: 26S proteasome non-ATPase regulatory subunit 10-like [Amphimedon queenslandica]